jgi:hypothetical protein
VKHSCTSRTIQFMPAFAFAKRMQPRFESQMPGPRAVGAERSGGTVLRCYRFARCRGVAARRDGQNPLLPAPGGGGGRGLEVPGEKALGL